MDWRLLSKSDERSAVSRKHLESAVTKVVKSVLDCEAFVGVIIQRIEPKSRTDPNWAVRSDNFGAALLLGSKYDSTSAERIVFTFAPMGDSVRVVAASMFVTNPGSAFEQITPVNAGEGVDKTQATLQEIKQSLEVAAIPPQVASPAPKREKPKAAPVT
jgi:hypothetical protein